VDLVKPAEGKVLNKSQVTLKWNPAICAESYAVVVLEPATGKRIEKEKGLVGLKYKTTQLKPGQTYRWKVIAVNHLGRSGSGRWEFTTP
jgi:hypothetical protein